MSCAVASPEQIRIVGSNLVYLIENVIKRVLWNVARVLIVWRCAPFARFYRASASFRLLSTAVGQSAVSCCANFVLSVKMCVRKVDESDPLSLSERLLLVLLVDETSGVRGHTAQNECNIFFETDGLV